MLFNSQIFLFLFMPAVFVGYMLLVRRSPAASVVWLAVASYVFYLFGEKTYPWLLAGSIALNYACGVALQRAASPAARRTLVTLGVAADLAVLGVFKYANFLTAQAAGLGLGSRTTLGIVLPVGISFFTFTQIAYLVDTYRSGRTERSPQNYALFVSYFPHLIAGPILHHKEMMPQFRRPSLMRPALSVFPGLCLFAVGLAKKVLIADPIGRVATGVFGPVAAGVHPSLYGSWVGALAYTAQIYFDFSGYSDMALGLSLLLGIRLPVNFNSPYKASSIIDFWRRWHITLSRFLRDYLYIALGGNRKGRMRRHLNLFVTMLLGGLWHGAGWTFVVWGGAHGAMLFLAHGWRDLTKRLGRGTLPPAAAWALTFVFVVLAWVPFRSADMGAAARMWGGMFGLNGAALPDIGLVRVIARRLHAPVHADLFGITDLPLLALALVLTWLAPNSQQLLRRFRIGLDSPGYAAVPSRVGGRLVARFDWKTAVFAGALLALSVRAIGSYSEFIYFQF